MKYSLLQTLEMAKLIEVESGTCRIEGLHIKLTLDGVIEEFEDMTGRQSIKLRAHEFLCKCVCVGGHQGCV